MMRNALQAGLLNQIFQELGNPALFRHDPALPKPST